MFKSSKKQKEATVDIIFFRFEIYKKSKRIFSKYFDKKSKELQLTLTNF